MNQQEREFVAKLVRLGLLMGDYFQVNMFRLTPLAAEFEGKIPAESRAFNESYAKGWLQEIENLLSDLNLQPSVPQIFADITAIRKDISTKQLGKDIFHVFPSKVDRWAQQILAALLFTRNTSDKKAGPAWFGMAFALRCVTSKYEVIPQAIGTVGVGAETVLVMARSFLEAARIERQSTGLIPTQITHEMQRWISDIEDRHKRTTPVQLPPAEHDRFVDYLRRTERWLVNLGDQSAGTQADPRTEAALFISYRRSDSQEVVGRMYDRLRSHFPVDRIFRDLDSIPLGKPFPQVIREAIGNSQVALVIIGPKWATITGSDGHRLLDDPADFVRIEVEGALCSGVPVVPVLVSGASMPLAKELPASLQPLVYLQGMQIRSDPDFHRDMDRLIGKVSRLYKGDNEKA